MQQILSPKAEPESGAELQPESESARAARGRRTSPGKWFGLSVAVFALTLGLQCLLLFVLNYVSVEANAWLSGSVTVVGTLGFGASVVLALWASARAVAGLLRVQTRREEGVFGNIAVSVASLLMMAVGIIAALLSTFGFSRGRQLRRRGRVLLPPVKEGGAWASAGFVLENAASAPQGLAEQWRQNGRTEHASVASFARLTMDLMALGAPPRLVASANQDALDEIRHTEACFSLAQAIDGRSASPGAFPEAQSADALPGVRTLAFGTLAVTSLVDGALHEGVSARIIAKLARRCQSKALADMLKRIAADEGRHAAHGWDVVEWCLAEGGVSVAHALLGALRVLPERMRSDLPDAARGGAWEPWGIHGHGLEVEEYAATRAQVVTRVQALVAHLERADGSKR